MTEHMIERYECDGCGWDGLDNQGPDGGCEAYFADRPDGGRNILCRWCVDHEPLARLAAAAVFPEQRKDDYLRATVVAQTTLRILRAWNEDEERQRRELDASRRDFMNRRGAGCTFRPGCDCGICEPEKEDAQVD
jgi:hypothetical protein